MDARNIELVRSLLEDSKDLEKIISLMHPDCEWHIVATGESRHGHAGMREMVPNTQSIFSDHTLKVDNIFATEKWVCAEYTNSGTFTGPIRRPGLPVIEPTGKSYKIKVCLVCSIRDGLIDVVREYHDMGGMLRQLGVSLPSAPRS